MATILSKPSNEVREQAEIYRKKANNVALVKRLLPKELLEYNADSIYVTVYSGYWISLSFYPSGNLNEVEQYQWAKQMQLYLDSFFTIKWNDKPECSEYSGNMWFSGKAKLGDWELWLSVGTAKPPRRVVKKIETVETKEVVTVRYEAECPPDLSEVAVGVVQNA